MSTKLAALSLALVLYSFASTAQSLEEKIGQMVMVGLPNMGAAKDTLIADIQDRNLGGVLLFGYNITSPQQVASLNAELQDASEGIVFIGVDQEGGNVARLNQNNGYQQTYTAYTLGTVFNNIDSTATQAAMMAQWLKDAGFNLNLAPVVDVNVNPTSPAIGNRGRSFSNNETDVFIHASAFMEQFHQQQIATALKHFPGHGSATTDSHLGFTDISSTWQDRELAPYQLLVEQGYRDMIMTGHLFKQDWDDTYPASLSHYAITSILRDSLEFEGVVISDELFMQAISNNYGFDESIVKAINAGTDILLFNTNIYQGRSLTRYIINLVKSKITQGVIDQNTVDEAHLRITTLKQERFGTSTSNQKPLAFLDENSPKLQAYPNPMDGFCNVRLHLPEQTPLTLYVSDTNGRIVDIIAYGLLVEGFHQFTLGCADFSPGIYLLTLKTNKTLVVEKLIKL